MKRRVGLLQGGASAEREISLRTGAAVETALIQSDLFQIFKFDPSIPEDLTRFLSTPLDVAFIALHGPYGEDGTIQGLCELKKVPYTGSGVLGSALAMNKNATKRIARDLKIPTPRDSIVAGSEKGNWVIKPNRMGSTVGCTILEAPTEEQWKKAYDLAKKYDEEVVIEEFIRGRELTASIFEGTNFPLIEIKPKSGFYDYTNKYTAGNTEYLLPAPIDERIARQIADYNKKLFPALSLRGAARSDWILTDEGIPYFLEFNTIPGMTPTSLLPKAAAGFGWDFSTLVKKMIEAARCDF